MKTPAPATPAIRDSRGKVPRQPRPGFVGLIRLDTAFPRPVGDIGNRNSFGFPVRVEVVRGASAERAVRGDERSLLTPFIEAGHRLVKDGAVAITTSCGFLAPFQRELADALPVPVATSALLQIAWANALLPGKRRAGVITIDARALGERHLQAAGAPADTPITGLPPDGELARSIFGNRPHLDRRAAERELVEAGLRLLKQHPEVATIVLECTNLPPYRAALARATGVPILDCNTLLEWLWRSVGP